MPPHVRFLKCNASKPQPCLLSWFEQQKKKRSPALLEIARSTSWSENDFPGALLVRTGRGILVINMSKCICSTMACTSMSYMCPRPPHLDQTMGKEMRSEENIDSGIFLWCTVTIRSSCECWWCGHCWSLVPSRTVNKVQQSIWLCCTIFDFNRANSG